MKRRFVEEYGRFARGECAAALALNARLTEPFSPER